jgi:hypothetical protein
VPDNVLGYLATMIQRAAAALILLASGVYVSASTNPVSEVPHRGATLASADPSREVEAAIALARLELVRATYILNSLASPMDPAAEAYIRRLQRVLGAADVLSSDQLRMAAGSLASELQTARIEIAESCTSVRQWLAVARAVTPEVRDFPLPARFVVAVPATPGTLDFHELALRAKVGAYNERNARAI